MNTIKAHALRRLDLIINLLKFTLGFAAIAVGIDKFFGAIAPWGQYVSPEIFAHIPLPAHQIIYAIGIIEIIVGVIILSNLTRLGAYVLSAWLFVIIINLLSMKSFYDIVIRDFGLAIAALALGMLITLREQVESI